jgi:hypothetical protein
MIQQNCGQLQQTEKHRDSIHEIQKIRSVFKEYQHFHQDTIEKKDNRLCVRKIKKKLGSNSDASKFFTDSGSIIMNRMSGSKPFNWYLSWTKAVQH